MNHPIEASKYPLTTKEVSQIVWKENEKGEGFGRVVKKLLYLGKKDEKKKNIPENEDFFCGCISTKGLNVTLIFSTNRKIRGDIQWSRWLFPLWWLVRCEKFYAEHLENCNFLLRVCFLSLYSTLFPWLHCKQYKFLPIHINLLRNMSISPMSKGL